MTPQSPAPRPAACDLDAVIRAVDLLERVDGGPNVQTVEIRHLAADLAHTRAERDAALAALPDAQMLDSYATGIEWEGFEAAGLRKAAARIRALDAAPAPVPAADVADELPAFLAHRANGGRS